MKKNTGRVALTGVIILAAIALLVSLFILYSINDNAAQQSATIEDELGVDFNNPDYEKYHERYKQSGSLTDYAKETYAAYHPSVLGLKEKQNDEGLSATYTAIFSILSDSDDAMELLDVHCAFLKGNVAISDPQLIFSLLKDSGREGWTDNESAAADYLIALAYIRGDFKGAIISDAEKANTENDWEAYQELLEKENEIREALRQEGITRLENVFIDYPESPIAVLAHLDYIGEKSNSDDQLLEERTDILNNVMEEYPGTAFVTAALICLADAELSSGNPKKAEELLNESLALPDYRINEKYSAHDFYEVIIERIRNGEKPPYIID